MPNAVEVAESLGIRPEWCQYAVFPQDGIAATMRTYPSIQFGTHRQNRIFIQTSNELFYERKTGDAQKLSEFDLSWYESETKTRLPDEEPLYHLMAKTRVVIDTMGAQTNIGTFFEEKKHYHPGLNRDLKAMMLRKIFRIFDIPNDVPVNKDRAFHRHFTLEPLARAWRTDFTASRIKDFSQNDRARLFSAGIGEIKRPISALVFGQTPPLGKDDGWVCFLPIDIFEQLYLSWLDDLTNYAFHHFIQQCGLIVREP